MLTMTNIDNIKKKLRRHPTYLQMSKDNRDAAQLAESVFCDELYKILDEQKGEQINNKELEEENNEVKRENARLSDCYEAARKKIKELRQDAVEYRKEIREGDTGVVVKRAIVQIQVNSLGVHALCNDGTLWGFSDVWFQYPNIPQDKAGEESADLYRDHWKRVTSEGPRESG